MCGGCRQYDALEAAVLTGLTDADPDARTNARVALWCLFSHYPDRVPAYGGLALQLVTVACKSVWLVLLPRSKLAKLDSSVEANLRNEFGTAVRIAAVHAETHVTDPRGVSHSLHFHVWFFLSHCVYCTADAARSGPHSRSDSVDSGAGEDYATESTAPAAAAAAPKAVGRTSMGMPARVPVKPAVKPRPMRTSLGIPATFEEVAADDDSDEEDRQPAPAPTSAFGLKAGAVRVVSKEPKQASVEAAQPQQSAAGGAGYMSLFSSGAARRVVAPAAPANSNSAAPSGTTSAVAGVGFKASTFAPMPPPMASTTGSGYATDNLFSSGRFQYHSAAAVAAAGMSFFMSRRHRHNISLE